MAVSAARGTQALWLYCIVVCRSPALGMRISASMTCRQCSRLTMPDLTASGVTFCFF